MQRFLRLSSIPVFWRNCPRKSLAKTPVSVYKSPQCFPRMASSFLAAAKVKELVQFLELVGKLKHLKRTGWVLRGVENCETVSAHMYRMSMVTLLLDGREGLDRIKCMELALIHDLAECIVGDITPYCGISKEEKRMRELKAMHEISQIVSPMGPRIMPLYYEYEEGLTPEARFVKDLDRLDMVLQAFEYEKRDNCLGKHQEFIDSVDGKELHPFVELLVNEIKGQRSEMIRKQEEERRWS